MKSCLSLLLLAFLFVTQIVHATDVIINWTPPIANVDGTTPAAFEGFNLYRATTLPLIISKTPGPLAGSSTNPIGPGVLAYTDKNVAPGTYYYGVTAWHCETAGCTESVATVSGAVVVKVTPKTAAAPGAITITINGAQAPK